MLSETAGHGFPKSWTLGVGEAQSHRIILVQINLIPTKPVEGQKTGTSGLRKKVLHSTV